MPAATLTVPRCRYAELAARVSLIRTGRPAAAPLGCEVRATLRVRIEEHGEGIASWTVAEVCACCAHMARDLPGFLGNPWPIPVHASS
jgi:hypothetical protein